MKYQITAIAYDKRGRVLGIGRNSLKTHPLQASYNKRAGYRTTYGYLHAEVAALLQAGQTHVHRLVISRYFANGLAANSKPCVACSLAIREFGVKHVVHT